MIHLEGFISPSERAHLLSLGEGAYNRSQVYTGTKDDIISDYRTSDTAVLPNNDTIVQRIISRASSLQGFTPLENHEKLQLTRYKAGQQFKEHWDHFQDEDIPANETQRVTTIFAILEASCEECGTRFPRISVDWSQEDQRWCRFIDCNDTTGITIKPIPGNALFWKNLNVTGDGDHRTLHAGLPPLNGTKTGLNIWTH
ncbi:prolyl 4-hydroxylase alpha [Pyrenophora tritici-repentis]|nr:prolyl 4-hydroxylase alpha [Pyrenophora tritici-repentis]